MKKSVLITLIICFLLALQAKSQQVNQGIDIPKEWKFQTGDNPEFRLPEFKDQNWKKINPDDFWENQGYEGYDGIAWYRTRIVIPSSLKKNDELIKAFRISLGRIDDEDITYLNGQKIGTASGWNIERSYLIPFGLIHWDQENVIAIRVNDMSGNGGMHGGTYAMGDVQLSDVLALSVTDKP